MAFRTAKAKKSLTYSIIILLIISGFLLAYLYYFIPDNKKIIHNNGFLILQTIAKNINEQVSFRLDLYQTFYENAASKHRGTSDRARKDRENELRNLLDTNKIRDTVVKISPVSASRDSTRISIEEDKLRITLVFAAQQEKVVFTITLRHLLRPILSTQKTELFHAYLLGKMTEKEGTALIYQDRGLGLRTDWGIDSLLPKDGTSFLKGIRDLELYDVQQKMFYYPFRVRGTQLMVGGLVELKTYNAILRNIPFYFVYTVSILFLFLLVSLPIIKFYIMDANEPVRVNDVFLFGLSIFLGASILTLVIIHFCLWKGEEIKVFQNLRGLSEQIKDNFNRELQAAYQQLVYLDSCKNRARIEKGKVKDDSDRVVGSVTTMHAKGDTVIDYSRGIRSWAFERRKDTSRYVCFRRISWADSQGEQQAKADLYTPSVYTNVARRKYFQVFERGIPYSLPGHPEKKIGLEPLYSKTNADFNITISKEDTAARGYIVTMATKMRSVMNTILPDGYGFCVIDDTGNVQLHSDMDRNLNENLFQKVDAAWGIKNAVASRQLKEVNGVTFYGKIHQIRVQPLDHLPFYLVTFYDKGYIVPVNMRILVFTLSFCLLFVFICWIMWLALTRRYSGIHHLTYCPMDAVSWLIPKKAEENFYGQASGFILFYGISFLGFGLLNDHYESSNANVLVAMLLTPINIGVALYAIRSALTKPVTGKGWKAFWEARWRVWIYNGIQLLVSSLLFCWWLRGSLTLDFLLYQLAINGILWVYTFSKGLAPLFSKESETRFLRGYNVLATGLVLTLAVLPSAMFTWYAHNQELIQSVKRQQLHLANAIYDRSLEIKGMHELQDSVPVPDDYIYAWRFSNGIYTINKDSITYGKNCPAWQKGKDLFDEFYFAFADKMSTPYYKQQAYTVLADTAGDNSWYWQLNGTHLRFLSDRSLPEMRKKAPAVQQKSLVITSQMPQRFIFLRNTKTAVALMMLVLLLSLALYRWLKTNSRQIFGVRYTTRPESDTAKGTAAAGKAGPVATNELSYNKEYNRDWTKMYHQEKAIIEDIHAREITYKYIWKNCTEKEKFLLYNMAKDGLLNYKNSREIIELVQRGLLIIDCERIWLFSPGFRAFILGIWTEDNPDLHRMQKKYLENSTWHLFRMPLLILLIGMAAVLFFTQQGAFDKLLILAGGLSTLLTLVMRFMGGGNKDTGAAK